MTNSDEKLLFGKSGIKGIVGLESNDATTHLFIQQDDGTVKTIQKKHFYWILSNTNICQGFKKLEGNLHYKYGVQFTNLTEFLKYKKIWKEEGHDIYAMGNSEEACMVKDGYAFYQGLEQKDISLISFDLETTGLDGNAPDAKILLISTTFRDKNGQQNLLFKYTHYADEKQMLADFFEYLNIKNPSLLIGHNIITFDMPYIQARCEKWELPFKIGRNDKKVKFNKWESKFRLDGTRNLEYKNVSVYGREIVDTYFLANSFDVSKSIETYALKPMIKQLGFEKPGRQYYDAQRIRDTYQIPEEWVKICQYAEDDAEDPVKLWDYMGPLYFNMAPMIPKPFSQILLSASGSKINALMVRAYLQDGHSIPKADIMEKFKGALSFAVPGIYDNCFKIDLAALYPSIMIQYKVYDEDKDPKAYLLKLVEIFREKRLEYKKLAAETGLPIWKEMDTTAKSILNSFYGFCAATGLNFNSISCAEFITKRGREILEFTIKHFSGKELSEFVVEEVEDEVV